MERQPAGRYNFKREDSGDGPGIKIHHEGSHDLLGHRPRGPDRFDPPSRPSASSRLLDCSTAITAATLVAHTRGAVLPTAVENKSKFIPIVLRPISLVSSRRPLGHHLPYHTIPYHIIPCHTPAHSLPAGSIHYTTVHYNRQTKPIQIPSSTYLSYFF